MGCGRLGHWGWRVSGGGGLIQLQQCVHVHADQQICQRRIQAGHDSVGEMWGGPDLTVRPEGDGQAGMVWWQLRMAPGCYVLEAGSGGLGWWLGSSGSGWWWLPGW
jgi:hypothetical protein